MIGFDKSTAFLKFAEQQMPAPVKARQRATDKRVTPAVDNTLAKRGRQVGLWRLWHCERLDAALAGPHGAAIRRLIEFLNAMTLHSDDELIDCVCAVNWREADSEIRFLVTHLIDGAITRLRERHGLLPFDDTLPWTNEKPTAFRIIRELLR